MQLVQYWNKQKENIKYLDKKSPAMRPNLQPKIYKSPVVAEQLYHMYATTQVQGTILCIKDNAHNLPLRRVGRGRSPP